MHEMKQNIVMKKRPVELIKYKVRQRVVQLEKERTISANRCDNRACMRREEYEEDEQRMQVNQKEKENKGRRKFQVNTKERACLDRFGTGRKRCMEKIAWRKICEENQRQCTRFLDLEDRLISQEIGLSIVESDLLALTEDTNYRFADVNESLERLEEDRRITWRKRMEHEFRTGENIMWIKERLIDIKY